VSPEDAQEFTEGLGMIVTGSWRQVALGERLGVPAALGLTTRQWVEERLGGYVRLALPERREAVAELTADGMSQRQVAAVLGVGNGTVARDSAPSGAPQPQSGAHAEYVPAPSGATSVAEVRRALRAAEKFASGLLAHPNPEALDEVERWLDRLNRRLHREIATARKELIP